jgi:hypothetical protein
MDAGALVERNPALRHSVKDSKALIEASALSACSLSQEIGGLDKHMLGHCVQESNCCRRVFACCCSTHECLVFEHVRHVSVPAQKNAPVAHDSCDKWCRLYVTSRDVVPSFYLFFMFFLRL